MIHRAPVRAQLEGVMAKGQKRSNREVKKPKKTAAERAKSGAASPAAPGLPSRDWQKKR
jgi:hypothetical protein